MASIQKEPILPQKADSRRPIRRKRFSLGPAAACFFALLHNLNGYAFAPATVPKLSCSLS